MSESISDLVPATLSQLGLPVPSDVIHTMLIRDCRFVGYKLSYDGGYAVWESGGNTLEFTTRRESCSRRLPWRHGKGRRRKAPFATTTRTSPFARLPVSQAKPHPDRIKGRAAERERPLQPFSSLIIGA